MSEKENTGAAAARGCDRAEEFVTYLYGEAEPAEARAFRRHLEACAVCRDELAALGVVREGLGLWRAEALGTVPSL
ncbi:MAG TPA: zf-HC2 domain-containing protein, partial [Pyrinomonadaceae bacterium]